MRLLSLLQPWALASCGLILLAGCAGESLAGGEGACSDGAGSNGSACGPRQGAALPPPSPRTAASLAKVRADAAAALPADQAREYRAALARERANDFAGARALLADLSAQQTDDDDSFAPYIQFALGEMLYKESAAFGSYYTNAAEAFGRVLEHPPSENPLYAFALLRVAQIAEQMGERGKAKETFSQVASEFAKSDAAAEVPGWAR